MDVLRMADWPPALDIAVDGRTIGGKATPGLHVLFEEAMGMVFLNRALGDQDVGHFSRSFLLGHDERPALAVRFIELHHPLENLRVFWEMFPEAIIPEPDGVLGEMGKRNRLFHGNRGGPAPQDEPKCFKGQLEIVKPAV